MTATQNGGENTKILSLSENQILCLVRYEGSLRLLLPHILTEKTFTVHNRFTTCNSVNFLPSLTHTPFP